MRGIATNMLTGAIFWLLAKLILFWLRHELKVSQLSDTSLSRINWWTGLYVSSSALVSDLS